MENKQTRKIPLLGLIKANILLISLITILITLISVLYGVMYVKPVYTVKRSVILRTELVEDANEATNGALASLYIVQMKQHFTSAKYIELANKEFALINENWKDSKITASKIDISYNDESLIFSIMYTDTDKELAIQKINAVYNAHKEYFSDISAACEIKLITTDNSIYDTSKLAISVNNGLAKCILVGVFIGLAFSIL